MVCRRDTLPLYAAILIAIQSNGVFSFVSTKAINLRNHRTITRPTTLSRHMFTGIVEEIGTVISLEERDDMPLWDGSKGKGTELTVKGKVAMDGAYLG